MCTLHVVVDVAVVVHVVRLRPPTGLLIIPQMIYEYGELSWNDIDRGKLKNSETCPYATLSISNSAWTDPGANLCLHVRGRQLSV
jgi:hypothetical protein